MCCAIPVCQSLSPPLPLAQLSGTLSFSLFFSLLSPSLPLCLCANKHSFWFGREHSHNEAACLGEGVVCRLLLPPAPSPPPSSLGGRFCDDEMNVNTLVELFRPEVPECKEGRGTPGSYSFLAGTRGVYATRAQQVVGANLWLRVKFSLLPFGPGTDQSWIIVWTI